MESDSKIWGKLEYNGKNGSDFKGMSRDTTYLGQLSPIKTKPGILRYEFFQV